MSHRVRRMIALVALFTIMSMLIAACGGGGGTNTEAGATTAPTTAGGADGTTATTVAEAPTEAPTEAATEAATEAPTEAMTEEATTDAMTEETATVGTATEETATVGTTEETATVGTTEETATVGTAEETATTETAATSAPAAAITLPADCTNVELQYWNPFTGPDGPFMGQMVDTFNSENQNVRVTMTTQSEYYTQIETAAAAQQLPDIAIIHADQVATWAFRGVLRPIDDIATQIGVSQADFPEGVWNAGQVAGQRYSIPLDIHPMTMFYNQDLLSAAGINSAPTNREEFEAAAQAMTQGENNGFMLTQGFPIQQIFSMLLHQYGGTWFNEDGTQAAWNSDAGVQALQWLKDTQGKYSQPNLEVDAELNAFKGGTVGMIWNGIWQTTNVTGEGVEFNGQATAVPQIGPQPAVWAGSHQFTLPTRAGEADQCRDTAAAMFIRWIIDNSVTWAQAGQIPANNTVRATLADQNVQPQASIAPSVENAVFPPSVPGITDAFGPLDEAVSAVMSGQATDIKAALDDAANRANQILQENQTRYGDAPQAQP